MSRHNTQVSSAALVAQACTGWFYRCRKGQACVLVGLPLLIRRKLRRRKHPAALKTMDIQLLQDFFFWSTMINGGIYIVASLATLFLKGFLCAVMKRFFEYDRKESLRAVQRYLATYKLLITVFNFTPWIVILIIN